MCKQGNNNRVPSGDVAIASQTFTDRTIDDDQRPGSPEGTLDLIHRRLSREIPSTPEEIRSGSGCARARKRNRLKVEEAETALPRGSRRQIADIHKWAVVLGWSSWRRKSGDPRFVAGRASKAIPKGVHSFQSGNPTTARDPKTRQAMNKHQCEPNAARMLQDAGRASQQARNVSARKPWFAHKTSDDKSEKTQLAKDFEPVQDTPFTNFPNTSKARSRHRSPISTRRGPR
ncbi:hypothetical protein XANCAGTX0491_001453 [Xanthoria calcicola]